MKELEVTPEYQIKPKLIFVGKLLGMDLYIDIHAVNNPMEKRDLAEKLLKDAFGTAPPKVSNVGDDHGKNE